MCVDLEAYPTARLAWSKSVLAFGTHPVSTVGDGKPSGWAACRSTPPTFGDVATSSTGRNYGLTGL
ncbi:MAG: hypothetical protein J0M11_01320 [Anaerolineae bacterium]|nr:hypothetical protein [Anaerolineae bacterium]